MVRESPARVVRVAVLAVVIAACGASRSGAEVGSPAAGALCGSGIADFPAEECDATDLREQTCQSLGFASGELRCSSTCDFDTTGCDPCLADPRIVACEVAPVDARAAGHLALATGDSEIVLAWTSSDPHATGVRVARFGANLALVETSIVDPRAGGAVALARTPGGYVLAFEASGGVQVQPLDAKARPRGRRQTIGGAANPELAPAVTGTTARGAPLLTWTRGAPGALELHAAVLADDGTSGAPLPGLARLSDAAEASSVYADGEFLVATDAGPPKHPIRVTRIRPGGDVGAGRTVLETSGGDPHVVWVDGRAWLVHRGGPWNSGWWRPLGRGGAPVGGAEALEPPDPSPPDRAYILTSWGSPVSMDRDGLYAWLRILQFGDWHGRFPVPDRQRRPWAWSASTLGVMRAVPGREEQDPADRLPVTRENVEGYRMAALGDDFVVAWLAQRRPHRIGLVRGHYEPVENRPGTPPGDSGAE